MNTQETNTKTTRRSTAKQRRASKLNGSKSRGPITDAGKQISRRNSLIHGLSGEGKVLIEAQEELVEERAAEWAKAAKAENPIQEYFIRRAAIASVQLDVIEQLQATRRIRRLTKIEAKYDQPLDPRLVECTQAAHLVAGHLDQLLKTPQGCDRLVELWADLGESLLDHQETGWTDQDRQGVLALLGSDPKANQIQLDSQEALQADSQILNICRRYLRNELADLAPIAHSEANGTDGSKALLKLVQMVVDQILEIEAKADELEEARSTAKDLAIEKSLVDLTKAGQLLQRYQTQASNEMSKMLREVRKEQATEAQKPPKRIEPGAASQSMKPLVVQKTCDECERRKQERIRSEAVSPNSFMNTMLGKLREMKAEDAEVERQYRESQLARS